jgi:hypothetical protein
VGGYLPRIRGTTASIGAEELMRRMTHVHSSGLTAHCIGRVIFETAQSQLVKEVNRRILSGADRFVFAPKNDKWIEPFPKSQSRI